MSDYLYRYYKVKPWVLIDEYDTAIQSGYLNNHYQEAVELMRGLLGSTLKGNAYMHRAVIMGILRIAKENLFSDLNNVKVFSVLNPEYSDHFGFTETEVDQVLKKEGLEHLSADIKHWYNGYHIGNSQIYNPWSIANCINAKGSLGPYWVNTSGNDLIKQTMARAGALLKTQLESLLEGKPIEALVDENITFSDLDGSGHHLWNLLLFAGYLTALKNEWGGLGTERKCLLVSPNREISSLYHSIIVNWFADTLTYPGYQSLLKNLVTGNLEEFLAVLRKFLRVSASYFDVSGQEPEKFYHGFVMGLIVSLSETHQVKSNKESGNGRYDVLLIPKDPKQLGLILEFKVAKNAVNCQDSAQEALEQINKKGYAAELEQQGVNNILKVGLAFYGKEVELASAT